MLRSYLLTAWRAVRRRPLYAALNVAGLAIGMAACLLIGLYADDELRYDAFHEASDRLVMMGYESGFFGRIINTPPALAVALREEVPQAEAVVRTLDRREEVARADAAEDAPAPERRVLLAEGPFFDAFSFPLVVGDAQAALERPDAAVLTATTARALFGDADPLGQPVAFEVDDTLRTFTVAAVAADPPRHSTIQFDVVAPMLARSPGAPTDASNWGQLMYKTYALLRDDASADAFEEAMQQSVKARLADEDREGRSFFTVPLASFYLSDLHQADGFQGQRRYLLLFVTVAAFILLIACINYVNLVTAQATRRAQEVGVRKTVGAGRGQLAAQFIGESVLLSGAALAVAWGLLALGLPAFGALFGKTLTLSLEAHGVLLAGLSATVLGAGVLAGLYPAFVLARFEPVTTLRGRGTTTGHRARWLHKGLVVTQFAISVALLACTAVVYGQLQYVQDKQLGFDGEQVVSVGLDATSDLRAGDLAARLRSAPGVEAVSVASAVPGRFMINLGLEPTNFSSEAAITTEEAGGYVSFSPAQVDAAYLQALGLEVVAGRGFTEEDAERPGTPVYVLNEAAARALGWTPEEAVGKPFSIGSGQPEGAVIGVVRDFHVRSMHQAIPAVSLQLHAPTTWGSGNTLVARLSADGIRTGMEQVKARLAEVAPEVPFEYTFLDDTFDAMYRAEERLGHVFGLFAAVAIAVACLGLFGLATYAAETRTKEIGIRKALGASAAQVVQLLTREFAALVAVAFVLGVPAAYVAMAQWLEAFAYRVALGPSFFAGAGALALVVALATVGTQALRAARTDPARALRSE